MDWWHGLILGLVQGIAEFLPISSSGHLTIMQETLGIGGEGNLAFDIAVHVATVLSTLVIFWKPVFNLGKGAFAKGMNREKDYILKILVSMIPILIVGLFFKDWVERIFDTERIARHTGNPLLVVGICLIVTAVLLLISEIISAVRDLKKGKDAEDKEQKIADRMTVAENATGPERRKIFSFQNGINYWQAFLVGVAQSLAVLPGLSRSGSTIATGLMAKVRRVSLAQFVFIKQWSQYLDLTTFLRHFLVGELSGNTDTYWSVYMYKHRDNDTIYTGPVWDFDLAFENDDRTYPIMSLKDYIYRTKGSCAGNMRTFVDNIVVRSANAKAKLLELWAEARQGGLTEENMVDYIDAWEEELQQSQRLNFLRWPIMNQKVHQNPKIWGSYTAEVQNVRRFMKERIKWMDNKLGYIYEPSGITVATSASNLPDVIWSLSGQPLGCDMSTLPPGIYVVRQGQTTRKMVKTK